MGRPTKLDEPRVGALIDALKVGCTAQVACRAAGVGRSTFKAWLARGKSPDPADAPYRAFRAAVQKARGHGERHALGVIHGAMPTHWQAAAWFLERSQPRRWGRVDRLKAEARAGYGEKPPLIVRITVDPNSYPDPDDPKPLARPLTSGPPNGAGNRLGPSGGPPDRGSPVDGGRRDLEPLVH